MNTETNDKLMTAAAQLSTEIAPQRDLWSGIEGACFVFLYWPVLPAL